MKKVLLLLFLILQTLASWSQNKYDISKLLDGVGMNAILNNIADYNENYEVKGDSTIVYYNAKNSQNLSFIGHPIQSLQVCEVNDFVVFIGFTIEKATFEAKALGTKRGADFQKDFKTFVSNNSPTSKEIKKYLNQNFNHVSDAECEFDCFDKWISDYSEIHLEHNNYFDKDSSEVKIQQSLIIKSTLFE